MITRVSGFTEAHTPAAGAVAGYLSIDPAPERGVGAVELTVRSRAGVVSSVTVPSSAWARIVGEAAGRLARDLSSIP